MLLATAASAHAAQPGGPPSQQGQHGPAFTKHGVVQANPRVVLIFWGWTDTADERLVEGAERSFFDRLAGSAYGGILAQYGVHDDAGIAGIVVDNRAPPRRELRRADIYQEVLRAQRLDHLPYSFDTQWIVLPPAGTNLGRFPGECGEHGRFRRTPAAPWYIYDLVLPYQTPGCGGTVADVTATTSHEFAEAATNPLPGNNDGWWIRVGANGLEEIGDICDWQNVQPWGPNGPTVQALWSNASQGPQHDRGCVQRASGGVPST